MDEAYCEMLMALANGSTEELQDARLPVFLKQGYEAHVRQHRGHSRHALASFKVAMALISAGASTSDNPLRPTTPPGQPAATQPVEPAGAPSPPPGPSRPPSPPPGPSRPPSPQRGLSRPPSDQPGPSKRPRDEDEEPEDQPTLEVLQTTERELKRFKATFREEVMAIRGLGNSLPTEGLMESLFDSVLQRQREAVNAADDDRVIVELQSGENTENPLWFNMRRSDQLSGRVILDKLERVLNSNQSFLLNGEIKVSYIHIPLPRAGGRRLKRVPNESMDQWLERNIDDKKIFSPANAEDAMCLTRCVAVAKARGAMHRQAFYKMKDPKSGVQTSEALALCKSANIDPTKACGLDEVQKLQDALPDYRICVFTDKKGQECVFKGPFRQGCKNIYLLLHREHFYAIFYPCTVFEYHMECEKCIAFYNNKLDHRCEGSCWRCLGPNAHDDATVPLVRCAQCRHQFAGDECMENHKTLKMNRSTFTKCDVFKFCSLCEKSYSTLNSRKHVCGFVYCRNCKENCKENHLCYMSRWTEKEQKKDHKYITIYYDIESTQYKPVEGKENTFEHVPNLLVCQAVCKDCSAIEQNDYFCTVCQTRQHVFHNLDNPEVNVMGQFIDYLQSFPAKHELLVVAHNSRAFDGVFVLQELIARKIKVTPILQGAKILSLTTGNWKFIDSLLFLPMPLSAMPKSFGLTELKKGFWPFLANKPEFYKYEGPLLDKDYYCVSTMKSKAAADFHTWYDEQAEKGFVFNFRRELIEYCISDVAILRQACQAFRKLFVEVAGFDPMYNCLTLSAACMAAFRRNFLQANKIGIVPPGGYHGRGKQSHIALRWLDYEQHKLGIKISTIYADREVSVLGRPVDGYAEVPLADGGVEKRIFQFHGCYWHQCPTHFPVTDDDTENRYERTQRLSALFRRSGYKVIEMWECEFKRQLESDPEVKQYFQTHPTTREPPLDLRDGLAGGRTSALRMYHKADLKKGEKIKMADVVSEYPNANLRAVYPIGHPEIFLQGSPDMPDAGTWNGMIKCTVLPPRDLFLPVLPYKCNGKLMFPLCRTCAEQENTETCRHTPLERQLTSSWCAPELLLAVQNKGYELLKVHEVYQYPGTSQYNPETREDGVLSAYVRCFMALKIQASGWPADCVTEEQKAKYIEDTLKCDGVILDPTKMVKNSALRTLAKLMCNSFWGKFGEKTLRPQTCFIYKYEDLIRLITDPKRQVSGLIPLGDECLQVTSMPVEDSEVSLPTSSLIHASFTTCHGRLQLYRYLDIVEKRALYHDTDSVAYISRPGELDLPLGTHLGDLTDQVEEDYGPGSFITEFAAGGPKNYAYKVAVGGDLNNIKVCIKVRGITINKSCDDLITFENLKAMVMGEREKIVVPIPHQIARLPTWKIVTRSSHKNWQAKNTKRRRVGLEMTVPHGYNAWEMADEEDQDLLEVMDLLGDA